MKIIDNAVIEDEYDVIIVGAGNGGVNAAALLGKKGFKTLVIEQHYIPGGCCTAIRRKGIAFDVGAAMLFGWNPETGYKPHVYVMNEIEEPIDMIPHDAIYRMHLMGDKSITFWRDFDKFFAEITAVFPHQKEQLGRLYKEFFDCYETLVQGIGCLYAPTEIDWKVLLPKVIKKMRGVVGLIRNLDKSIQDLLDKYGITDRNLIGVFDFLIATFFTTTCAETPAIMGPVLFADTHRGGCFYPSGSPQMLPNKLEKGIEKFDGQIIYRHKVEEIVMEKNYAIGVRLDDGTFIKAKYVISDTTIWNLYGGLIKKEHIKLKRYEWAQHFIPTMGLIILYMGVKAEVIPKDFHSIMVWIEDLNKFDSAGGTLFAFIPSLDDPSIAPEGTHSLSILVPGSTRKWPSPGDPFYKSEEYNKWKQEEADKVIDHLEKYIPGIRKAIITLEIATPTTLERFTLKNWGCVAGPKQMLGQHMFKRPSARTEWDNVLMVGDSTTFGEGVVSTTSSAITAVNAILKDNEMPTYEDYKQNKNYVNLIKGKKRIPLPKLTETLTGPLAERLSMECNWCPDSKNSRCMKDCPANIDVLNFIRRIEAGNYTGASRSIRELNPLGEICGIICPAEKLCQKNCYRNEYEKGPVEIPRLQAWVCKEAGKEGFSKHIAPSNGLKVAVVGAGPAGMTCAYFLARLGYSVDVYEKKAKKGGMLTHTIPNFRLPEDTIQRDLDGISLPSINFIYGKSLSKDVTIKQLSTDYKAVFIAPGLWSGKLLKLSGMDKVKTIDALSFISIFREKGVVDVKDNVLIIGGGSVAADAASVAKKAGAKKITLICLEKELEMPCLASEREEMIKEGVEIHDCLGPKEFLSPTQLSCICCTSVFDSSGKFCPEFDESKTETFEFEQVIMAVGQELEQDLASYLQMEFGTIRLKIDPITQKVEGWDNVYAGGDLIRGAGTVVHAVADGRRAAKAIDEAINKK